MPIPINISASRAAAILELSGYATKTDVWLEIMESREPCFCEKNNYEKPERVENAAMRWGTAFEDAICELAENKRRGKIIDREKFFEICVVHKGQSVGPTIIEENPGKYENYLTCHIDGQYSRMHDNQFELHEGKTTSQFYFNDNFGEPGTDAVPMEYQIQCQHQMICTGAEKVILSVLVFPKRADDWEAMGAEVSNIIHGDKIMKCFLDINGKEINISDWAKTLDQMGYFHQYEINANPELQKLMLEKYEIFWNENVLKKIPPEAQNYDDIKKLIREPVGTIIADEQTERFALEYMQINNESGKLDKRKSEVKTQILKRMKLLDWTLDDESEKKWILRDGAGNKLGQYDGKSFRAGRLK